MPADADKKTALAGMSGYMKAFPDMALSTPTLWAAGDYVVAAGSFTGTNKGAMPSMGLKKPTGKPISVRFFEIVKFENGKAKEDWTFFNSAAFASQLGMK
jgi:predicted ester cyclase